MEASLSIPEIEKLVADRAKHADRGFSTSQIHVYEDSNATDLATLIVQLSAKRPQEMKDWTRLRLRLSQSIRDALVERGDNRYPLIEIFGPEEWADRNG